MSPPTAPTSSDPTAGVLPPLRKALSFPVLLGALLVGAAYANTSWNDIPGGQILAAGDTWWHIMMGRGILATGHWPTIERYSFTLAGDESVAYEWLGDLVIALAERLGSWQGLAGLLVLLSAAFLLLMYRLAYLRSRNAKAAAAACAVLLPVAAVFFSLRPQLLGFIFLMITLIRLERYRQGSRKSVWVLPLVFLAWVNTHGTFALGLLALGVFLVSGLAGFRRGCVEAERWKPQQRRELLVVLLLCVAVLPITPYGSRLAAYPLEMAFLRPSVLANISEWYPLTLQQGVWAHAFLSLLLIFVLAQALLGALVYRLDELALLAFAVYESCLHVRFLFFFAIIFAPLLARLLSRWAPAYHPEKDKYALNAALIGLLALGVVALFPSQGALERAADTHYPRQAVEFLRHHAELGPTFNENAWGGYLIWSGQKVFIDGRDVYEHGDVLSDYVRIINLDAETLSLLRKYGVKSCLLMRGSALPTFLGALPDWEQVYSDRISTVFVRGSGATK